MDIRLKARRAQNGLLVLDLGVGFRFVFAAIVILLITMRLSTGSLGAIGVVVLSVSSFGVIYDERWEIDPERERIRSRQGVFGLWRTRNWPFQDVSAIRAVQYRSGTVPSPTGNMPSENRRTHRFFQRLHVRYEMVTTAGELVRFEVRAVRSTEDIWAIPAVIAATVQVPLEKIEG